MALGLFGATQGACNKPGAVGDACDSFADCEAGLDCVDPGELPGGYCTTACDPATPKCPAGSSCLEFGLCFAECADSDDCRDDYVCSHRAVCELPCAEDAECPTDFFCAGDGVCIDEMKRPPPKPGEIGAPCGGPADCDPGLTCLPPTVGGTCSSECADDADCTGGTRCVPLEVGGGPGGASLVPYCVFVTGDVPYGGSCGPIDGGACAGGLCWHGVCTEACDDATSSCPGGDACREVELTFGTTTGTVSVCDVPFPLPPPLDVVDLGPFASGDALQFMLPADAVSFTIVIDGEDNETYLATMIEAPDGHFYVTDEFSFLNDTDPIRTRMASRYYALTIPSTDRPGAELVGPGVHTFTALGDSGMARVYLAREPNPTRVDLNFYFIAGTTLDGTPMSADAAQGHPVITAMIAELQSWYAEVGIGIGHINWFDLDRPGLGIVADTGELEDLFAAGRTDVPPASFDIFFVDELPGGGSGMTGGIAGGIPGGLLSHANSRSGVALTMIPQGQVLGIALFHELGHQIGLYHSKEASFGEDPLLDTPSCPDANPPTNEPCASTSGRNFMYWSLILPLWTPDEPLPNCSFCPSQRALVRATPMTW